MNDVLIKRFQETDKNPPKNTIKQTLFRVIPSDNHLIIQLECTGKGGGGCAGHKSYNEIDTISRAESSRTTSLDQVSLRPSFLTSAFSPRLDTNVPISSYTTEAYKQEPFPPVRLIFVHLIEIIGLDNNAHDHGDP